MEDKYIGYIEGYLATTDVDSQGDRLTPGALEHLAEQMKVNPSLRTTYLSHDTTQPIGYVVDFHTETKDDWKGLRAKVGVYKTRPDIWKMVESGKLKGFSFGAKVKMAEKMVTSKECNFSVEAKVEDYHQIADLLSQSGAEVETIVQKAADFPTLFNVATSILALPGTIYGLYTLWQKIKASVVSANYWVKIKTTKRTLNFDENTIEEIIHEVEVSSKHKK
jgi:HK97 family phage prohead protease